MRHLDLFSGIGGFALGLQMSGPTETLAFVEQDPYCQKVLKKHWPDVPIHDDVVTYDPTGLGPVDIVTGGFPCQDISLAGRRQGLDGARSGLWSEFARILGRVRPRYAIVENTPGLLSLGMGTVFGDLAEIGYDAEWHCIPACYIGADHIRDRVWIIAYPSEGESINERRPPKSSHKMEENDANALQSGLPWRSNGRTNKKDAIAISEGIRLALRSAHSFPQEYRQYKPVLGRRVHGIPNRVDRLKGLGNAVVPQVVAQIAMAIRGADKRVGK